MKNNFKTIKSKDAEIISYVKDNVKFKFSNLDYDLEEVQKEVKDLKVGDKLVVRSDDGGYIKIKIHDIQIARDSTRTISGKSLINRMVFNAVKGMDKISDMSVSEWAQKFRFLDKDVGNTGGKYDCRKTPYLIEIMDSLTAGNGIEVVVFMKSAQIGGSEAGNNWLGYIIDINPSTTIFMTATKKIAEKYSKTKLRSLFTTTKRLADKMFSGRKDTITNKSFKGGTLNMIGSNSGSDMRSDSACNLFLDEVDTYPLDINNEGDPIDVIKNRVSTAGVNKKIFIVSTPSVAGYSKIEKEYLKGDQRHYHIPCRHCGFSQVLQVENLRYRLLDKNDKLCDHDSVFIECSSCKGAIEEKYKNTFMNKGVWIPSNHSASEKIRSYHINALYSPLGWKTWGDIVDEKLASEGDEIKIKSFYNTTLGLPYREKHLTPDPQILYDRKSDDWGSMECPDDVIYINAGVDTQDDRLAYQITGYGSKEQIYVLHYDEIEGDTREDAVYEELYRRLKRPIKHKAKMDMYVKEIAMDSGGHRQNEVFNFASKYPDFVYAIRGRSDGQYGWSMRQTSQQDTDRNGNKLDNSVDLFMINTLYMKKIIYRFCAREKQGEKYVYFNKDLELDYFSMLCSEDYLPKVVNGFLKEEFVKLRNRNESLDCFVYSLALARFKNFEKYHDENEYKKVYNEKVTRVIELLKNPENASKKKIKRATESKYTKFFG